MNQASPDTTSQPSFGWEPPLSEQQLFINKKEQRWKKTFTRIGASCLIAGLLGIGYLIYYIIDSGENVDKAELEKAKELQQSVKLPIGVYLDINNDDELSSFDTTVEHSFNGDTGKIYVWDIDYSDGDYVQVLVDGVPLSEPFLITSKPKIFDVPSEAVVEVKGIRDVNSGISYGITFSVNEISYYNYVDEQQSNRYTLIRK